MGLNAYWGKDAQIVLDIYHAYMWKYYSIFAKNIVNFLLKYT